MRYIDGGENHVTHVGIVHSILTSPIDIECENISWKMHRSESKNQLEIEMSCRFGADKVYRFLCFSSCVHETNTWLNSKGKCSASIMSNVRSRHKNKMNFALWMRLRLICIIKFSAKKFLCNAILSYPHRMSLYCAMNSNSHNSDGLWPGISSGAFYCLR